MTRARWGALAVLITALLLGAAPARAQVQSTVDRAILIEIDELSFDEAMAIPEIAALSRAGGAALLVDPGAIYADPTFRRAGLEQIELARPDRRSPTLGEELLALVGTDPDENVLVILVSKTPPVNEGARDELAPIVMALGAPAELFPAAGPQGSLTSDSTHRDGVIASADVGATFLAVLPGVESDPGDPIEIIEGPPPFELHDRYLAQRRLYVPVGTAGAIYIVIGGLGAITILALGDRVPSRIRRLFGWWSLSVPMLAVGMLAVGHLPELSYATAVPMIAIVTVFGTMAFSPLERRDVALVPVGIGLAALAYFALEAILGWSGMLTPLLGGSQLDGGRFYGLPNVAIGVLIGSGLWVAHRLRTALGFALLCGLGLFAGLPYVGTNLGGAVSLFAAAGLWLTVRERDRLGVWRGIGAFVGVTLLGAAVILLAHAVSPLETHVSRFEEDVSGPAGVVERVADRLQVGFDLIARNPFALIPVVGLPIAIAAVLWPPAPLRPSLARSPAWRDAILVTLLAGVVAYVANDSGPAAAGFAFGMGLGGLLGVSLLLGAEKMVNR